MTQQARNDPSQDKPQTPIQPDPLRELVSAARIMAWPDVEPDRYEPDAFDVLTAEANRAQLQRALAHYDHLDV